MLEEDNSSQCEINIDTQYGTFPHSEVNRRNQILAALSAAVGALITGTMLGWSSPGIPNLNERQDFGVLTNQEKSWIGSIATLGAVLSGFVAGFCIEKFGRKYTMLLLSVPSVLGWLLMACSQNVPMILVARFITGFAAASFLVVGPVYITEVVESEIRGIWGTVFNFMLCIGILLMYVLGTFVSWIWLSIISAVVPVIMFISMSMVPESPRYLLSKGKLEPATASLKWLRGTFDEAEIETELKLLQKSVHEDSRQPVRIQDLLQPSIFKPLSITMALMFFQQFGGINAVIFFSLETFKTAASDIDANVSSITIIFIQVIVVGMSAFLVDRCGRRILFIISDTGMAISLAVLGLFFFLKFQNGDEVPKNLGWLPLVSLVVYIISYNLFLGPGPWLMMSELLPSRVKGLASAIASSFCWLLAFVVTKTFEDLSSSIHPHGCYWLFSSVSVLGIAFGCLFLPETKGKTLDEIQNIFK